MPGHLDFAKIGAALSAFRLRDRLRVNCEVAVDIRIEGTTVVVTFSRRNLQALLHRLDHFDDHNYTLLKHVGDWTVRVHVESDERHYTQRPVNCAADLVVEAQIDHKVRLFPRLPSTHWLFDGKTQCPVCHRVFTPGDEVAMWIMARPEHVQTKEAAVVHWLCVPEDARDNGSVPLPKEIQSS